MASSADKHNIRNRQISESDSYSYSELCMSNDNWPRYLVMTSASEETNLNKLSPFAEQKGFQAIAGILKSIKRLRVGSRHVECGRKAQTTNLL